MNPLALLGLLLAALAIAVSSYQFGRHVMAGEVAEQKLTAERQAAQDRAELQDLADDLAEENAKLRAGAAPVEKLITKEVLRYVDVTPTSSRCTLPGTWRLRHDAAASGVPLATEAGPVGLDPAAGVEDAAALETVSDNYAAARECFAKLAYWQRRYHRLEQRGQP